MRRAAAVLSLALAVACSDDSTGGNGGVGGLGVAGAGVGASASGGTGSGGMGHGGSGSVPDICKDIGTNMTIGAAIFGDAGTQWFQAPGVDWTYGYMYAAGDPHQDLAGFTWLVNFRLDTAAQAGAALPTVTFYRMLGVGSEHGHTGSEAQIVQAMLGDSAAVFDYLDDLVALLQILGARGTPTLLHVEPDSWGFMMWAFDGVDPVAGNGDAASIPVSLSNANHPALAGQSFADNAAGLGQAMLYLRDQLAPNVRMGWHASNFRVGTRPDVVSSFYSALGPWDVMVTEPPHMVGSGTNAWDPSAPDNANNLQWLATVSQGAGLPILVWQTYVDDADAYLGGWPANQANMTALAESGVAGVLWDPNGNGGDCAYACPAAGTLHDYLVAYSAAPLPLPSGQLCAQ
ncbi:MAG: hypothetical protein U0271_38235 [Polyangiaceae bacterium]